MNTHMIENELSLDRLHEGSHRDDRRDGDTTHPTPRFDG